MVWTLGNREDKTVYIPTIDKETGKEKSIPVTTRRMKIIHESGDCWELVHNRRGYTLKYPPSYVEIETRGYHRPSGTKIVENRDASMDAKTLVQKLVKKFGKKFTVQIVNKFGKN